MKSFDCTRKLPLLVATGTLLAGAASASGVELWAVNNLPQGGAASNTIETFDSAAPAVTNVIGETGVAGAGFGGLDFHGDGTLYAYVSFGTTPGLYMINQGTGQATVVGSLSGVALNDIAYNPTDGLLYGIAADGTTATLVTIDTTSGAVTNVGTFTGTGNFGIGMGVDSAGSIYIHDIASDEISFGGLIQVPLYTLPYDSNFSQGLFVNWSGANEGFHGALNNTDLTGQLWEFATDGSGYNLVDTWPNGDGGLPIMESGDLTALPSGACPPSLCPWDISGPDGVPDGVVGVDDLLALLAGWGTDGNGACIADPQDEVEVNDLLGLLANWGDCPEPPDPANDFCADADELGPITTITLIEDSLVDATTDGVGNCQGVDNDGAGRWYVITGTGSSITASLCNAANENITFDGRIHVFCGDSCTDLNCIAANDDAGCGVAPGNQPEVTFCTAEGVNYYILVHMAAGGEAGDYTLELDTFNDACEPDAECIPLAGDSCSAPLPITNGDTNYDTTGYDTDGNPHEECKFDDQTWHDLWFTYTADFTGLLTITTCNQASYDTDLVVYDNSGPAPCPPTDAELLACNDDTAGCDGFTSQIDISVSAGDELLIRVGGWQEGDQGAGTLSLIKGDIFEFSCPDGATEENEACLSDGDCNNLIEDTTNGGCNSCVPVYSDIACGESVCGTGFLYLSGLDEDCDGQVDDFDGDGSCGDGDILQLRDTDWYRFTLTEASDVTLSCSADSDALFGIVDISDCPATFVSFGTVGAAGGELVLTASLPAGDWVAFAAPNFENEPLCGSEMNYAMTLDCGAQATGACCTNGGADCEDGVAEADCAAQGGEFFASQACADIECTPLAAYQADDGSSENGVTWNTGGCDLWFQRYDAIGGSDTIVDIACSFGDPTFLGSCLAGGETAVWAIYEGTDPNTATHVADGTFTVDAGSVNTDVVQIIDIPDTVVNGSFFIAIGVDNGVGCFEMPLDETNGGIVGDSWIAGDPASILTLDLTNPGGFANPPFELTGGGFPSFTIIRGNN